MKTRTFFETMTRLEESVSQIFMAFIVFLVFIAALTRFIGYPINWSVDIAQAVFVWVIYIGANQALRNSRHIGIDLLFNRFNARVRFVLLIAIHLAIIVFLATIIVGGIHITVINAGRILNDIPISYSFVTIAVPVGSFLMILTTIGKLVRLFREKPDSARR